MLPNQHPGFPAQSIGTVPFEKPVHKKIVSQTIICEVTHEDQSSKDRMMNSQ